MRWCWRRRTPCTREQIVAAARAGKHVFTEKPLGLTAAAFGAPRSRLRRAQGDAGGRLQLALPARAAGDRAHARRRPARQAAAHRRQFLRARAPTASAASHWRQDRDEAPAGGMTGRGVHVVDAMLYLAGAIDTVLRAELPACAGFRRRRHDLDAVPLQERRHRLSGHGDRIRRDMAHAGVRLQGLGGGGRRGAPHHLADEGLLHRPGEHHRQAEAAADDIRRRPAPSAPSSSISRAPSRPASRWRCPAATRCTTSPCWRRSSNRRATGATVSVPT